MRRESPTQALRQTFLEGCKAATIHRMLDEFGSAFCEKCKVRCESFEAAMSFFHQHHKVARDKGIGYRRHKGYGVDHPSNLCILCPRCHEATEPGWNRVGEVIA